MSSKEAAAVVVMDIPTGVGGVEEEEKEQAMSTSPRLAQKKWALLVFLLLLAGVATAGVVALQRQREGRRAMHRARVDGCQHPYVIPVWSEASVDLRDQEEDGRQNVTLTAFVPSAKASSGTSVVIAPGGSYYGKAFNEEGLPYARWLCAEGVASYVLDYRTADKGYHSPLAELDARRALRTVRSRLRPSVDMTYRVGMIGSSAGGHLTATVLAYHDEGDAKAIDPVEQESSRPDFGVLVYPVITMEDGVTHPFSKSNLLGPGLTAEQTQTMTQHYSIEKHVTRHFPPTFLYTSQDDATVPVENSYRLDRALIAAKVVHETAIYEHGQHGSGLGIGSTVTEAGELLNGHPWTARCVAFLTSLGILE